jgi:cell division protein FtsN
MAPRKAKGRQAVRNSSGGFPAWAGILVGILIGALVVVVLMRHSLVPMAPKGQGPQPNPEATAQPGSDEGLAPAGGTTTPKKPQYDFYSVLSEKEVRIPDSEISAQAKAEQQQAAQQAKPTPAPQQQLPANAPAAETQNITAAPTLAPQQPAASTASAPAPSGYLLQVGAFPSAADAETLKAKLALQGFVANVQSVSVGGQTYHRVRLGPFHSATDLESAKQRLSAAGIPAIALKEGK